MRTITQKTAGGPEVLVIAEVADPTPGPGEVLVRVSAAGINPVDAAVRGGYYRLLGNPPFTVGWDISGTVEAIGSGVSELTVGDAVFGMPRFPSQAAAYAERSSPLQTSWRASRRASTTCRQAHCRWPA